MQIVSYNIQFGTGRDEKVDLARIADTVRGADLIALQEVPSELAWSTKLRYLQACFLSTTGFMGRAWI